MRQDVILGDRHSASAKSDHAKSDRVKPDHAKPGHAKPDHESSSATLDDLFRRALERRPDALALLDPPDREYFTDHPPRRLTYAEADKVISGIAQTLRAFGLPADSIVGVQLPNIVESVLMILGTLRAGLVPAAIPVLWRTTEMAATLGRIGARALISCRQVGTVDHGELAMQVAAETFVIRFVCGFGDDLPDGVVGLDSVFHSQPDPVEALDRNGHAGEHVAIVTFDVTSAGIVPVARSHAELIAGGSAVLMEMGSVPDPTVLAAFATSSFAGLATTVVPWLLSGGTLSLHQPFSPQGFASQRAKDRCDVVVVPGPLVVRLRDAGLVGGRDGLKAIIAVWRAPERLSGSAVWAGGATTLIDVPVFGEIGLVAQRRGAAGKPAALPAGRVGGPGGSANGRSAIELARTPHGTVAFRGPMVPLHPFPPGVARRDNLRLKVDDDGFIDSEFACRVERDTKLLVVTSAPPGIVSIGGYRFALRDLQNLVAQVDDQSSLTALPDMLAGQRLAGAAADRDAIRQALSAQGANPLLVAAFRGRRPGRASAA
jgi:hypothetical protein